MSRYNPGDHLIICDSCGAERFRSECQYTWDGFLMCTVRGCWYPRHAIFDQPPIINDPATLQDVRPDQVSGTEIYVSDVDKVGKITTWSSLHVKWGALHKKWGHIDDAPNYIGE